MIFSKFGQVAMLRPMTILDPSVMMKNLLASVSAAGALALVLSIPGLARANQPPAATTASSTQVSASTQTPGGAAAARLPAPDSMRKSKALLGAIQHSLKRVQVVHDAAVKQRAALPENCVAARITEIKALVEIAGESMAALDKAVSEKDDEERVYQLSRLGLLAERAEKSEAASRTCIGHDLSVVQTTKLTVETESEVPQQDPAEVPVLRR
jgi:hypothetical protein